MHSLTDLLTQPAATIIAAFLVFASTVFNVLYARHPPTLDRYHAKLLAILEFTQKRLELRDQVLKLELDATEDRNEQMQAKQRATLAVQRTISDANALLRRLDWSTQIVRSLDKKRHNLQAQQLSRASALSTG